MLFRSEVIDGCCAYIDNPDIDTDGLMQYIPAPDFPTGATIYGIQGGVKIEWTEKSAIASGTLVAEERAVKRVAGSDVKEELPQDEYD